ncbi:hypothetical protein Hanom_Chr07g00632101 [Helianthus anomalus]
MDFAQPYLFSFLDHLCQYLDYGPLFDSSNFNVFNTHLSSLTLYYCFLLTQTNRETQTPPSPFEVYYKLHYNAKKGWLNDEAKSEYFLLLIIHAVVNDFEPPIIVDVLVLI